MADINMELLQDFIVEADEHLKEMAELLHQLSEDPEDLDILSEIFRTIHNIKGGSQFARLDKVSLLAYRLEDLLELLRRGELACNSSVVELLSDGRDRIVTIIAELEEIQKETSDVDDLVERLILLVNESANGADDLSESEITEVYDDSAIENNSDDITLSPNPSLSESVTNDVMGSSIAFDEKHDKELLEIFNTQLKQQLDEIRKHIDDVKQGENAVLNLIICKKAINKLESSASYMGYGELVDFYRRWISKIEEAVASGNPTSLEYMDTFFNELYEIYPSHENNLSSPPLDENAGKAEPVSQERNDITSSVFAAFEGEADENAYISQHDSEQLDDEKESEGERINVALLGDFLLEATEYLEDLERILISISDDPSNRDLMNEIFRTIHNIKGGAQFAGLSNISTLAHRFEDLLDVLRMGDMELTPYIIDVLMSCRDRMAVLVKEIEEYQSEKTKVDDLVQKLTSVLNSRGVPERDNQVGEYEENHKDSERYSAFDSGLSLQLNSFDEEDDKELYQIFIDHMVDQVDKIFSNIDQNDGLSSVFQSLEKMTSSANYMGYENLVQLYSVWLAELKSVEHDGGDIAPILDRYLSKLQETFPELTALTEADYKSNSFLRTNTEQSEISICEDEKILPDGGEVDDLDKLSLESRLSSALSASEGHDKENGKQALYDVYDELISSEEDSKIDGSFSDISKMQDSSQPSLKIVAKNEILYEKDKQEPEKMVKEAKSADSGKKKIRKSVRVDAEKIDALMNQVGELVVDRSYFFQLINEMRDLQQHIKDLPGVEKKDMKIVRAFTYRLSEAITGLGRTSNELQEGVMKMRMLPISHIFSRYPRLVHDLTKNLNKAVKLTVLGEDTELDKMIVEELSGPLIHIIRNAVDHGLESEDERIALGKPKEGALILEAYQESNHIVIEVTDDGRGISLEKIKEKAISNGLYSSDELERMTTKDLTHVILTPGFSTAEKITGTSGRGVGMDVVKRNIEKLNGTIDIISKVGVGTKMKLKIPLTLAIIHALMVRIGSDLFTIPLANVEETVRVNKNDTSLIEGVEVIHLRGEPLPIFYLSELFGKEGEGLSEKSFVVVVSTEGNRTGFVVDELKGQEEVVIKPMADYVQERSGFSGATIIGDGRISLILDIYELVKMAASRQIQRHRTQGRVFKNSFIGGSGIGVVN